MKSIICVFALGLTASSIVMSSEAVEILGDWKGTLTVHSRNVTLTAHITSARDGLYLGRLETTPGENLPIDRIQVNGSDVRFDVKQTDGIFQSTLNAEHNRISGTWFHRDFNGAAQDGPLPLELVRGAIPSVKPPPPAKIAGLPRARVEAMGPLLEMSAAIAPIWFRGGDNAMHLVYELHLKNATALELHISRVDVLNAITTVASFEGWELNVAMGPSVPDGADHRTLGPRKQTVAFLWLTLPSGTAPPTALRHRITVDGYLVDGGVVEVSHAQPLVIGPPLRGSEWKAINGPANESRHRHSLIAIEGTERIAERFVIDWVKLGADKEMLSGDPKNNQSYHAYGNEVLAVGDGVIAETQDGVPENVPPNLPSARIALKNIAGNHVVLDLGADTTRSTLICNRAACA